MVLAALQFVDNHSYMLEGFLTSCSFDYLSKDVFTRCYILIAVFFGFLIPLVIIIVFYTLTRKILDKRDNTMFNSLAGGLKNYASARYASILSKHSKHSGSKKEASGMNLESVPINKTSQKKFEQDETDEENRATIGNVISQKQTFESIFKRENRLLRTIMLYVSLFLVAWTPYCLVVLLAQFGGVKVAYYINPHIASLPAIFAKISSIYNPILYTLSNRECKKYFKSIFKKD